MRIAVIGGSLAGLFVAALARQAGHDVVVYERSHDGLAGRGAGLVAQEQVFILLRTLGLEHLARVGVIAEERIFLDRDGGITASVPTPQMQISWDHLYEGVRALLPAEAYLLDQPVHHVGQSGDDAWLELGDRRRLSVDLVIGADGIGSAVRKAVTGPGQYVRYAGYVAWRALIPETALSPSAADTFLDRFTFYTADQTQALGYLVPGPLGEIEPGQRRFNWVWYRRAKTLDRTLVDKAGKVHPFSIAPGALSADVEAELRDAGETLLPSQFRDALRAEPNPFVQAIFDYEAPAIAQGRIALMGDAAFVVRPHTAMGVAKAAEDAMALIAALGEAPVEQALLNYQTRQIVVGKSIAAYGRRLGQFMD